MDTVAGAHHQQSTTVRSWLQRDSGSQVSPTLRLSGGSAPGGGEVRTGIGARGEGRRLWDHQGMWTRCHALGLPPQAILMPSFSLAPMIIGNAIPGSRTSLHLGRSFLEAIRRSARRCFADSRWLRHNPYHVAWADILLITSRCPRTRHGLQVLRARSRWLDGKRIRRTSKRSHRGPGHGSADRSQRRHHGDCV